MIQVNPKQLSKALALISTMQRGKLTMAWESYAILESDTQGSMRVHGHTSSTHVSTTMPCVADEHTVCVNAAQLAKALAPLQGEVTLHPEEENEDGKPRLVISHQHGECALPMYRVVNSAGESILPTVPTMEQPAVITTSWARMCKALTRASAVVTKDTAREMLQLISIVATDGMIELASTNGHQLLVQSYEDKGAEAATVYLPKSIVPVIQRMEGEEVTLSHEGNTVCIRVGSTEVVTSCTQGGHIKYPNYRSIIVDYEKSVTLKTQALADAVKRISTWGEKGGKVRLFVDGNTLAIESADMDLFVSAKESLTIPLWTDDALGIAFLGTYLLWLTSLSGEVTTLHLQDASHAAYISAEEGGISIYALVMPMSYD